MAGAIEIIDVNCLKGGTDWQKEVPSKGTRTIQESDPGPHSLPPCLKQKRTNSVN